MDAEFFELVKSVWQTAIFGIGVNQFIIALIVFCFFAFLRGLFARIVMGFLQRMAARSKNTIDDQIIEALDLPARFMFVIVGLYAAGAIVDLPKDIDIIWTRVIRSLVILNVFWALYRCVPAMSFILSHITRLAGAREMGGAVRLFFIRLVKFVIFCVGVAAVMEEWDFDVAALLGGLGLLGMAVAFGAQNLISNLFAGVSIFLDKIFDIGDWIKTKDVEGVVEDIGFRTTRVRRFDKAITILPNSALTNGPVINFSRMTNRRIYWKIGIQYNSTESQMRDVVNGIRDYVYGTDDFETDPERATTLINIDSFNASSIDIMLYCFTKTTSWGEWMEIKETLAYRIKDIVEGAGTGFAFPSTSIYLESLPMGSPEVFPLSEEASNKSDTNS